jgi:hypothetical protein
MTFRGAALTATTSTRHSWKINVRNAVGAAQAHPMQSTRNPPGNRQRRPTAMDHIERKYHRRGAMATLQRVPPLHLPCTWRRAGPVSTPFLHPCRPKHPAVSPWAVYSPLRLSGKSCSAQQTPPSKGAYPHPAPRWPAPRRLRPLRRPPASIALPARVILRLPAWRREMQACPAAPCHTITAWRLATDTSGRARPVRPRGRRSEAGASRSAR